MQIPLPKKPKIVESSKNRAVFEVEGAYPGYGLTLGNSFRRVLLSSLPGAAVVAVKIKGVKHEFSTLPHVLEDVIQIILNLKQLRFKFITGNKATVTLKVKGEREVTAADIKTTSDIEVISKEAHIATLTSRKADLDMEIEVEAGLGYLPVEQRKKEKVEIGRIALDASFTPIRRVYYTVDNMRVGDRTDFSRLRFFIETDGSITPESAFQRAATILVDHYKIFAELDGKKKKKEIKSGKVKNKKKDGKTEKKPKEEMNKQKIEDLKLSARTASALTEGGLKTVAGLIKKKEESLNDLEGLGPKGVKEVKKALSKLGLTLKQ